MNRLIASASVALLALAFAAGPAAAYTVNIDDFTVVRNGSTVLNDDFGNGTPPPDGPFGATTYGTAGTFGEGGGTATMTTATGAAQNFAGLTFTHHLSIFRTNTQPLEVSPLGLKKNTAFSVSGLFDMTIPAEPRESFGVMLTDRIVGPDPMNPVNAGNEQLEMRVIRTLTDQIRIQFQVVTYDPTEGSTEIQGLPLGIAVGLPAVADLTNDQIMLRLSKDSAGSDAITASYEYFDNGVSLGLQSFATTYDIFGDEDYTRAAFFAREVEDIPEPGPVAAMVVGLAALGFLRRRAR